MKVLVVQRSSNVADGTQSLSVEVRILEALEYLSSKNKVEFACLHEADPSIEAAIGWASSIIFSKHNTTKALNVARLASELGKLIIYDIDDWIFSFPSYSDASVINSNLTTILEIIDLADIVTVANQALCQRVKEYVKSPVLLPNGIWVEKHAARLDNKSHSKSVVFTNADQLKISTSKDSFLSALQIFFLENEKYHLDFFGDIFPEMVSLPFLHFNGRLPYYRYLAALRNACYSFAVVPLGAEEDIESAAFNACKSPFKFLNYGATGIPGIYSDSSIYRNVIVDGETGLLVKNDMHSWLAAMQKITNSEALRSHICKNSFEEIMSRHHVKYCASLLLDILHDERGL